MFKEDALNFRAKFDLHKTAHKATRLVISEVKREQIMSRLK